MKRGGKIYPLKLLSPMRTMFHFLLPNSVLMASSKRFELNSAQLPLPFKKVSCAAGVAY